MQMTYTLTEAKAHLSELVDYIEKRGASIVITRHGKPVAELNMPSRNALEKPNWIGSMKGQIVLPDDWDEWTEEEAKAFGMRDE